METIKNKVAELAAQSKVTSKKVDRVMIRIEKIETKTMRTSEIMEVWDKINGIIIGETNVENDNDTNMEKCRGDDEITDNEIVQMEEWNKQRKQGLCYGNTMIESENEKRYQTLI